VVRRKLKMKSTGKQLLDRLDSMEDNIAVQLSEEDKVLVKERMAKLSDMLGKGKVRTPSMNRGLGEELSLKRKTPVVQSINKGLGE